MEPYRGGLRRVFRPGLALALSVVLLASACGGPVKGPEVAPPSGEWHTFEGTGTSTGHRQVLLLGSGRTVGIFNMSGSVVILGEQRLAQGFRSETIGFVDSQKGGMAWCVWTDNRGDQVFGELRGESIRTGRRFSGTFLGGTGRYAGMTGDYEFEWRYVVDEEDGSIQGRITGLRGRFRRAATPPSSRREGFRGEEGSGLGPG